MKTVTIARLAEWGTQGMFDFAAITPTVLHCSYSYLCELPFKAFPDMKYIHLSGMNQNKHSKALTPLEIIKWTIQNKKDRLPEKHRKTVIPTRHMSFLTGLTEMLLTVKLLPNLNAYC